MEKFPSATVARGGRGEEEIATQYAAAKEPLALGQEGGREGKSAVFRRVSNTQFRGATYFFVREKNR